MKSQEKRKEEGCLGLGKACLPKEIRGRRVSCDQKKKKKKKGAK
jgi:hypothetical protein